MVFSRQPDLRRMIHNALDQKVGQVSYQRTEPEAEPLPVSDRHVLGDQARQKFTQHLNLSPMPFQGEEVIDLVYDSLDGLALARGPATVGLQLGPAGVILGSGDDHCPVVLQPVPLSIYGGEGKRRGDPGL
jgi:hypothetical protein